MNTDYSITFYLDDRRPRKNDIFIVKLRVYDVNTGQQKFFSTGFELSREDFAKTFSKNPKGKNLETSVALNEIKTKALQIAQSVEPFNMDNFAEKLKAKPSVKGDIFSVYNEIIQQNKSQGKVGNADTYQNSLNSIKKFVEYETSKVTQMLPFTKITTDWLRRYDTYMKEQNKSVTTISMYVRNLRAVFNYAISKGYIKQEVYPFGTNKGNYKIPKVKKVKKTLNKDDLKKLYDYECKRPEHQRAKDFYFFSYNCSGMNIRDIVNLRFKQINGDRLTFFRKKTESTASELIEISVYLTPFAHGVIERYGNPNHSPENLIFSVIDDNMSPEQRQKATKNFTRSLNQGLKKIAKEIGIDENISTYYARHSFSTNAIRSGASMEFVSGQLGHADLRTTQNYFDGFEDDSIEDLTKTLMTF